MPRHPHLDPISPEWAEAQAARERAGEQRQELAYLEEQERVENSLEHPEDGLLSNLPHDAGDDE